MTIWIVPLGLLCGLVLAATAVSLLALWRAHSILQEAGHQAGLSRGQPSVELRELRQSVEKLAARLHDLERHPTAGPVPGMPRPGLNLNKRSQALRMHRQGEPPDQIASSLELPRQEVDLLLKVHQIVIANV